MFIFLTLVNSTEEGHICRPPYHHLREWFGFLSFFWNKGGWGEGGDPFLPREAAWDAWLWSWPSPWWWLEWRPAERWIGEQVHGLWERRKQKIEIGEKVGVAKGRFSRSLGGFHSCSGGAVRKFWLQREEPSGKSTVHLLFIFTTTVLSFWFLRFRLFAELRIIGATHEFFFF